MLDAERGGPVAIVPSDRAGHFLKYPSSEVYTGRSNYS
jgi:hypothetical protein